MQMKMFVIGSKSSNLEIAAVSFAQGFAPCLSGTLLKPDEKQNILFTLRESGFTDGDKVFLLGNHWGEIVPTLRSNYPQSTISIGSTETEMKSSADVKFIQYVPTPKLKDDPDKKTIVGPMTLVLHLARSTIKNATLSFTLHDCWRKPLAQFDESLHGDPLPLAWFAKGVKCYENFYEDEMEEDVAKTLVQKWDAIWTGRYDFNKVAHCGAIIMKETLPQGDHGCSHGRSLISHLLSEFFDNKPSQTEEKKKEAPNVNPSKEENSSPTEKGVPPLEDDEADKEEADEEEGDEDELVD